MPGHNFNDHVKIIIIEKVKNESLSKSEIRNLLEHKEDFWILKLQYHLTILKRLLPFVDNYHVDEFY